MQGLQLTYTEFVAAIEMSKLAHILLEGSRDKAFFARMCEAALDVLPEDHVAITTAEELRSDVSILGNRDKVEHVCNLIERKHFQSRFVGFVDREFREFTCSESIRDELRSHCRKGRLVWSRGHSIENYLFEYQVIRQTLLDFSTNDDVGRKALEVLQAQFQEIMRIACALGMAAFRQKQLEVVRRTVNWKTMQLTDGKFQWDIGEWNTALAQGSGLIESCRVSLVEGFQQWHEIAKMSDPNDVRWACDGHIGFKLIWAAYVRAVNDIAATIPNIKPKYTNQREKLLSIDDAVKFKSSTSYWADMKGADINDSPALCLDMLGIFN